jgi:hypothetical protein
VYNVKYLWMVKECKQLMSELIRSLNRAKQIIFSSFGIYKGYMYEKLLNQPNSLVEEFSYAKKKV